MEQESPPLESLNTTELCEMIRRQLGKIVKRSLSRERLIEIIEYGQMPAAEEISGTVETRKLLQSFIEQNWGALNSQLPCKGLNRGKCTIFPCPEGRHLDCYTQNIEQVRSFLTGRK